MASRSNSAVRTWARNPDVGAENEGVSGCGSALPADLAEGGAADCLSASPSAGCSRRLPEPLGLSSLLMARHPDILSALYSNAEAVCAITRQGQEERHFRAAAANEWSGINDIRGIQVQLEEP